MKHIRYSGMMISRYITTNVVVGYDFAGTIEEIGPDVPGGLRKLGERVAGFIDGCRSNLLLAHPAIINTNTTVPSDLGGSFAEYCVVDAQVLIPIPDSLSYDDAAGVGMAGLTACQALWQNQDLPTPLNPISEPFPVSILRPQATLRD
jgi:NADPH:quinone reductase-like Zn-dependent oxidoreductase